MHEGLKWVKKKKIGEIYDELKKCVITQICMSMQRSKLKTKILFLNVIRENSFITVMK